MSISSHIENVRGGLRGGRYTSEAAVSQGILLPALQELGWPIFNTSVVIPEYSIKGLRVDYALCHPVNRPLIFIEVKKVGGTIGADIQLFEYAFHEGVPFAILTDGQEWSFYLPGGQGKYDDRRVYKLDILERDVKEASFRLEKYLKYESVVCGDSLKSVQKDYQDVSRKREIGEAIPRAWNSLIAETDSFLLELLAEKTEDMCGYKPDLDDCRDHIVGTLAGKHGSERSSASSIPVKKQVVKKQSSIKNNTKFRTTGEYNFIVAGQEYTVGSAIEVMIKVFQLLAESDSTFLDRFASRKHGRKRRYIDRDKMALYPGRPDLCEQCSFEITQGWWMGTNYSKGNIQQILDLALEVLPSSVQSAMQVHVCD